MQVNGINLAQTPQSSSSSSNRGSSLSYEQQTLIEETLAKYDTSSLSESDAKEIVEIFSEAGIEPSKELETALSSIGFDAKEIGDLAGVGREGSNPSSGGRPAGGPPPPPSEEETLTITELLESLLEEEEESSSNLTSSATTTTTSAYEDTSFTAFNTILDYTNQIINLKDDAKSEVMDILETYNTNEEQQDIQKSVVSSLNNILNKQENYNRMSFYV